MAPKEKWGTIKECRFPLGHQKMTNFELQQSVDKLTRHRPRKIRKWWEDDFKHRKGDMKTIEKIVTKLTDHAEEKVPDSKRVSEGRIRKMGVVNSFAWKGYN